MRGWFWHWRQRLGDNFATFQRHRREDRYSRADLGPGARAAFQADRNSAIYQSVYDRADPLVTICVATYNRGALLLERCVRSLLAQDYQNLQIVVVGDHCTDSTVELMATVRDERLQFVNLPERGKYPDDPNLRWMVAGTIPINHALSLARGDFVTHLDDDDEHSPDRVSKLLALLRETRSDIVYHPFRHETPDGDWHVNQANQFDFGRVTTSSIMYHRWFTRLPWDIEAWRYREPGDWNRLRKFRYLGVRSTRHPDILLSHYRERNQKQDGQNPIPAAEPSHAR